MICICTGFLGSGGMLLGEQEFASGFCWFGCVFEHDVYGFVSCNPLVFSDPLGLAPITDVGVIALYNQDYARSMGDVFADNWEYFVAAGFIIAGGIVMATGAGSGVGINLALIGGDIATQKYTTGEVDWLLVMAYGALGFGFGEAFSSLSTTLKSMMRAEDVVSVSKIISRPSTIQVGGYTTMDVVAYGQELLRRELVSVEVKTINAIGSGTNKAVNTIKAGVGEAGNAIKSGVIKTGETVKSGVIKTGETIKTGVIKTADAIESGVIKTGEAIKSGATKTGDAIKAGAVKAGSAIEDGAIRTIDAIEIGTLKTGNAIKSGTNAVGDFITRPAVKEFTVLSARESVVNVGNTYMDALIKGEAPSWWDLGVSVVGGKATSIFTDLAPNGWKSVVVEYGGSVHLAKIYSQRTIARKTGVGWCLTVPLMPE